MNIIVCGGRDYNDTGRVNAVLSMIQADNAISCLIMGDAKGADERAEEWAYINGVNFRVYYADWDTYGKGAGPLRNQEMLQIGKPSLLVAFPGGRGTEDMIRRCKDAMVPVLRVPDKA